MSKILYTLNVEPIKNASYTFTVSLISQSDTDVIQPSPTLAAGDVKISIDGGSFANIGTLPTEIESTGVLEVALTAAEMNGDRIDVLFSDVAGDEWQDLHIPIFTKIAVSLPEAGDIVDAAWDEALTAEEHNVPSSAGRRLREGSNVAISATEAEAIASGSLAIRTYHTFTQAITSTSTEDLGGASKFWLSVKASVNKADTESEIFIEETDGLTVVCQEAYSETTDGSLTVTGSTGEWVVTLNIDEVATSCLKPGTYIAELKALVNGGDEHTIPVWTGSVVVTQGIVRTYE
jgi:hypothetical protein